MYWVLKYISKMYWVLVLKYFSSKYWVLST